MLVSIPTTHLPASGKCCFFVSFLLLGVTLCQSAQAHSVWARKYRTSCITCHAGFPKLNSVGEAFRRNGFQFPQEDEFLVKDEPIPLGNDAYKDIWPDSLWPNDIPNLPPIAVRTRMSFNQSLRNKPDGSPSSDFQIPNDITLLTGGTLGKDISWYTGFVLAGRGGHGGGGGGHGGGGGGLAVHGAEAAEEAGLESELERAFVQFSNLFAWSAEEDDDGTRTASRWYALPRHALNMRVGQFEPQVIAPWASVHRQIGTTARLPNVATIGGNSFAFEPAKRGIELNGVLRQYFSYSVGFVNGNGTETAWDNNSQKDFYFRVARKWWGYPLDGVLATSIPYDFDSDDDGEDEGDDKDGGVTMRGQSPDDEDDIEFVQVGLDFWREMQFETGFFGYFGRNEASVSVEDEFEVPLSTGGDIELVSSRLISRPDRFERLGFDGRWQFRDLDIFGMAFYGWNNDPISDEDPLAIEADEMFSYFVEADYYVKPWLIGYGRYEQVHYLNDERQAESGISRSVVGAATYIRANMKLVSEFTIDAQGNGTTNDRFGLLLDFVY